MRSLILIAALTLTACVTPAPANTLLTPDKIAAGDDNLAQRATPSSEVVGDIYHWVHTNEYPAIEARLREELPNTTRRLYNSKDGVRVKYVSPIKTEKGAVYYWSAATGQMRRGTWDIQNGKFGPQICETFYGETICLNTVEQLSGVGVIDSRGGDVFGLARGARPVLGKEGLPDWVGPKM